MKLINISVFSLLFLFVSCVEFEHSENGDLDGYWHLVQVDTLDTGGTTDLSQERCFWMVQGSVFQLYSPDLNYGERYVSHFTHEGDQFVIHQVYFSRRLEGDPAVEDVKLLQPFGINSTQEETFKIEELKGGRMVLTSAMLRLTLKKS